MNPKNYNSINFVPIGIIHTPYKESAPYQPIENDKGKFYIELNPVYKDGLYELNKFRYIYVIYYLDRLTQGVELTITPEWTSGKKVGIFASRSPVRPNPFGLSVVRIKKIVKNRVYTTGLDVYDNTPLLDIKPYIKELDSKCDANYGWVEELPDSEHLALHLKGIPH